MLTVSPNFTPAKLKQWASENRVLAETVCLAKAFAQCERERVDAYIRPLFAAFPHTFHNEYTGETITDPDRLYLSGDLEDEHCKAFYAACDAAHREHGFDGPEGHCPALVAEDLQRQAEQALLDSLAELMGFESGFDLWSTLEQRDRALDLALRGALAKEII